MMTKVFLPNDSSLDSQKMCCYKNNTGRIAIASIRGLVERHCERVIFPGEMFLFEANDDCELEIFQQTSPEVITDVTSRLRL